MSEDEDEDKQQQLSLLKYGFAVVINKHLPSPGWRLSSISVLLMAL